MAQGGQVVVVVVVSRCLRVQVSRRQRLHFAHGRAACCWFSADMAPLSRRLAAAGGKAGGGSRALSLRRRVNEREQRGRSNSAGEAGSGAERRAAAAKDASLHCSAKVRDSGPPRGASHFARSRELRPPPPLPAPPQQESAVTFSSCSPAFRTSARVCSFQKGSDDNHNSAPPQRK